MQRSSRYMLYLVGVIFVVIVTIISGIRFSLELHHIENGTALPDALRRVEIDLQHPPGGLFPPLVVNGGYKVQIIKADEFELLIDHRLPKDPVFVRGQLLFAPIGGHDEQDFYNVLIKIPLMVGELSITVSDYSSIEVTDLNLNRLQLELSNSSSIMGYGLVTQQLTAKASLSSSINFDQANRLSDSLLTISSGAKVFINSDGVLTGSVSSGALLEYRGSSAPMLLKSNGGSVTKIR